MEHGDRVPAHGEIRTLAELSIDERGVVTSVHLLVRSGVQEVDDAEVRTNLEWKFLPALLDGVAVPGWWRTNDQRMRI